MEVIGGVSVVIVTFESGEVVGRCLEALEHPRPEAVVVVDNASSDGTAHLVEQRFPEAHLIRLDANLGFGAAANVGIDATTTSFVLLLNPDCRPTGDALRVLAAAAAALPGIAVLAPRLLDEHGRVRPSRIGYPSRFWPGAPAVSAHARGRRVHGDSGFAVGAALFLDRAAFDAVGGFDPSFFLFYEEVDLCWRLEHAGFAIASCDEARFVHVGGTATRRDWPRSYREQLRGHLRFVSKHSGPTDAERSRRLLVVAVGLRALLGRGDRRRAARQAFGWLRSAPAARLLEGEETVGGTVRATRKGDRRRP